jgi:hypothetical protein
MCWGALGIISLIYGDLTQQIFVLAVLAGISLTAFASMQSSPKTIGAFVIPALFPITAWFFYHGTILSLAIGTVTSRSRNAGYPAPPAQSRTCGIAASGSSVVLAFAQDKIIIQTPSGTPPPLCGAS